MYAYVFLWKHVGVYLPIIYKKKITHFSILLGWTFLFKNTFNFKTNNTCNK